MDNSFFIYLERIEIMGFFVAYPIVYLIIQSLLSNKKNTRLYRLVILLPYAYALVGTLYLGLQLKNLYPDFSLANINSITLLPYLKIWGLLSLLFWIKAFAKKPVISFLHSLVFFFFLAKDLILLTSGSIEKSIVQNEMKVFTDSILLNTGALIVVLFVSIVYNRLQRQ